MSPQDLDSPWKEAVDHHLAELLSLLAPKVHAAIDWSHDVESLEQELRKLAPEGGTGKRLADKLLKARTPQGDERYLHFEVQGHKEDGFERRVYTYHYRIDDRFGVPPESVVVLADEDPDWRQSGYTVGLHHTRLTFEFDAVKILDLAGMERELTEHPNPAALFVLAHLQSRKTRGDAAGRARVKLDLILRLHERKLGAEELRQWYRYLDWLLALPKEFEQQVWQQVKRLEQEKNMPFITFAERYGMELGLEKGLEKGIEQGLEKGIEQGLEKGERLGLTKAIRLGLKLKFGEAGLALMPGVERQEKLPTLQAVYDALDTPAGLDDLKRLLG